MPNKIYDPLLVAHTRRDALYGCMVRYAPETGPLRERALDWLLLVGLAGSSAEEPYKVGQIRENLRLGPDAPELRSATIQEGLIRLQNEGKVQFTEMDKKHAYFLEAHTSDRLITEAQNSQQLFERVITRHLQGTDYLVDLETGTKVLQNFLVECFTRFGRQIAKTVSGRLSPDELSDRPDIYEAFTKSRLGISLLEGAEDSLFVRCRSLLTSEEPEDKALKFHLAQTFYILELLDLEGTYFNPLAEEAFNGAVFYFDTNILIQFLLASDDAISQFDEILKVTKRIGIMLKVTRATINELRRVAATHINDLESALNSIPISIIEERVKNDFLTGFLAQKQRNPGLTLEQFSNQFDRISEILEIHGIELVDIVAEEMIAGRDFSREGASIQKYAELRGYKKPDHILEHDLAHYVLVNDARRDNRKTWFLTRDRSLAQAAIELANGQSPFSFSLPGLLQSLSPFSTNAGEEHSLAQIFSTIVSEQLLPTEKIFDLQEMSYLAKFHEDIFSTPEDQVIQALDVIKTEVFNGKDLTTVNSGELSLELRKRIASTDHQRVIAAETERANAEEFARKREAELLISQEQINIAQMKADEVAKHNQSLISDNTDTLGRLAETEAQLQKKTAEVELERRERLSEKQQLDRNHWLERAIIGTALSIVIFTASKPISIFISEQILSRSYSALLTSIIQYCGLLGFLISPLLYLRYAILRSEYKIAIYTIVLLICFYKLTPFSETSLSFLSNYIQVASFIALVAVGVVSMKRKNNLSQEADN